MTDQHPVGLEAGEPAVERLFARLLDAQRGERHPQTGGARPLDSAGQAHHLHPVELDLGHAGGDHRLELLRAPAERDQPRLGVRGGERRQREVRPCDRRAPSRPSSIG